MPLLIGRPPEDDDELWEYVRTLSGIAIPRVRVCKHHSTPFDAFAEAYFARTPVSVWKASRGFGGKSTLMGLLVWTEAVTLGAKVTVLGGSAAQSMRVHEVTHEMWESRFAPTGLLATDPTTYVTRLKNGGRITALMASQKSVRGPHPQRMRLDEIDEMDLFLLESAQGQPQEDIRRGIESHTVMSSTHQYPDKTMTAMLKRANEKDWPVHEWSLAEGSMVQTEHHGEVPIERLVPGTHRVQTRNGFRDLQHVSHMGWKQTIVVQFNTGRSLTLTPEHKVATPNGWARADSLTAGSLVAAPLVVQPQTLPTVSSVVVGRNVRIDLGVFVPPRAMAAFHLFNDVRSEAHVLDMSNILEMIGVDARSVTAGVVDLPVDDVVDEEAIRSSMSTTFVQSTDTAANDGIPVGAQPELPHPAPLLGSSGSGCEVLGCEHHFGRAPVGSIDTGSAPASAQGVGRVAFGTVHVASVHTGAILPVWDIGVHDEHEFVASGVVVHNCWRESMGTEDHPGWLTKNMVERKKAEVSNHMWDVEYDLQEPSFVGRAIEQEFVDWVYDPDLGIFEGKPGMEVVIEDPVRRVPYVTGVDWAKEQDWTVIRTYRTDVRPWREVAFMRVQRRPWPWIVAQVDRRMNAYGGLLMHDSTGMGTVIRDLIEYDRSNIMDVTMVGRTREAMFNEYIVAHEQHEMKSPRIEWAYGEHKYATHDDLFGSGHPPDSFVAGALAWHGRNRIAGMGPVVIESMTRDESPWSLA